METVGGLLKLLAAGPLPLTLSPSEWAAFGALALGLVNLLWTISSKVSERRQAGKLNLFVGISREYDYSGATKRIAIMVHNRGERTIRVDQLELRQLVKEGLVSQVHGWMILDWQSEVQDDPDFPLTAAIEPPQRGQAWVSADRTRQFIDPEGQLQATVGVFDRGKWHEFSSLWTNRNLARGSI